MPGLGDTEARLARARRLERAGEPEEAARAFLSAGAVADVVRVMRRGGRLDLAARMLAGAGLSFEAAQCHLEAGERQPGLERLLRVPPSDPRYGEAARQAVRLAAELDTLSVRFEQFVGPFISRGPQEEVDLPTFYDLAELYLRHDMSENAEEALAKLVERDPGYRDALSRLGALRDESLPITDSLVDVFGQDERFRQAARRASANAGSAVAASASAHGPAQTPPTRRLDAPTAGGEGRPAATPFAAGTLVADRYRIEGEIGRGGMATVYRAHDLELSEDVALKLFRPTGDEEEALARFRQELRVSRRLLHPNITRLYDIGLHRGQRYLSMELLVGHSLEELTGAPWALRRGLDCLLQVCEGLGAAHAQGVIHRDIKSANIFLTREGLAKIMDFGIARERAAPGVTQAGMIVGTPEYMAPEQIRGRPATERSDLYALGIVAYEMFAGRKPFVHDDLLPLLQMHLLAPPVPPSQHRPGLLPALEEVILTLMQKEPEQRFASARAVAETLAAIRGSPRG
ncbi:MAG TPA: serine/threonine-protein kinase [Vicinamibacteria bacterium]|nr:serine/threonine-protein kinase [Vicinamibacteria bacterium]